MNILIVIWSKQNQKTTKHVFYEIYTTYIFLQKHPLRLHVYEDSYFSVIFKFIYPYRLNRPTNMINFDYDIPELQSKIFTVLPLFENLQVYQIICLVFFMYFYENRRYLHLLFECLNVYLCRTCDVYALLFYYQ